MQSINWPTSSLMAVQNRRQSKRVRNAVHDRSMKIKACVKKKAFISGK
jgi:hypothetical protein